MGASDPRFAFRTECFVGQSDIFRQLLLSLVCLCGCTDSAKLEQKQPGGWTKADIVGRDLVFERDDGQDKSYYHPDGTVEIDILTDGKPPVAPLMYWSIDDDGYLLVSPTTDMSNARKQRLVSKSGNGLVVESEGRQISLKYAN